MSETPKPRGRIGRLLRARIVRVALWLSTLAIVLVSMSIVAGLTFDLGDLLRERAEREGSRRIRRPMHIGKLSVHLGRGRFVIEDFAIEGLTKEARPFFKAKRIEIAMPWPTVFGGALIIDSVELTDWQMVVETFPNNVHNFPKFTTGTGGPRRFTTTVRQVNARRGEFIYDDHSLPWSTIARNLNLTIVKRADYEGEATFSRGTITFQRYEPMNADMRSRFKIRGGSVHFDRIDLTTDGARSAITGEVSFARWPESLYQVRSQLDFPRLKEIFFARDRFTVTGRGVFDGTFRMSRGWRELKGRFSSGLATVNQYEFPDLRGHVQWTPRTLAVTDTTAGFYGGSTRFSYVLAPLGVPQRATARFDATYRSVDLGRLTDFLETRGLRLAGQATGRSLLEWESGRFATRRGEGHIDVEPPPGVRVFDGSVSASRATEPPSERGPNLLGVPGEDDIPIRSAITYKLGPEWVELAPSRVTTPATFVEFSGRTAYGDRSLIRFHVKSGDWQESNRVLAGFMTAFGARTRMIRIGGHGEFDGALLGSFRRPRIEGRFSGEQMRALDVLWGTARAEVVVENGYADVARGVVIRDSSEILVDGRFSLGYPRKDGGEEIDARVRLKGRSLVDLMHAFELYDYPLTGKTSGEFHVYGHYETPHGFGKLRIDELVAYGEPIEKAEAAVRFEGTGARLDGLVMDKAGGTVTGAAHVGWNGTYSFVATGQRIPLESVARLSFPRAPLSGMTQFSASGSGTFQRPRYDVSIRITDLFAGDEGIGQLIVRLNVREETMLVERFEAASPRLAISGSGKIGLAGNADSELTFRFSETSIDPYVRALEPRLSPFTTAVASGTVRVSGELRNVDRLLVDVSVEELNLSLFDYLVRNENPIKASLDRHTVRIQGMRLVGDGTRLDLTGDVGLRDEQIRLGVAGQANLGILQGFFRDLRSSGQAEVSGNVLGPLRKPSFSGNATISDGRIRHFSLPHSLESMNGQLVFESDAIRVQDMTARLGGGSVRLSGRIGLTGYLPDRLDLQATGERMRIRYPEGVRSIIDAELALTGEFRAPVLTGTVTVQSAVWWKRFEAGGGLLTLAGGAAVAGGTSSGTGTRIPLRYDVRVIAPSTLRIENNVARLTSSADLTLRGTYDRPLLFGRVEIERGDVFFEGHRFIVTRGAIDFTNPTRIEPFFDVEAETRVRVPGQTYQVTFHAAGTPSRFTPSLNSDPPLPTVEIASLLFGDPKSARDAELRVAQGRSEEQLIQAGLGRLIASPLANEVGRVFEETLGLDRFQITPTLLDPYQQTTRFSPSARLTIGKRLSNRVYLTYSRSLTASFNRDQIIVLEYEQTDRISWIVSQNEDRTYALDFRVRHVF